MQFQQLQQLKAVTKLAIQHRKDFLAKKVAAATTNLDKDSIDFKQIVKAEELKAL